MGILARIVNAVFTVMLKNNDGMEITMAYFSASGSIPR